MKRLFKLYLFVILDRIWYNFVSAGIGASKQYQVSNIMLDILHTCVKLGNQYNHVKLEETERNFRGFTSSLITLLPRALPSKRFTPLIT